MLLRSFVGVMLFALVFALGTPLRAAEPVPAGFSGRGSATITFVAPNGMSVPLAIEIGLAQRDNLFRLDVFSVSAAGAKTPMFPGPITAIFDRVKQSATLWSQATHMYASAGPGLRPASPTPAPSASPSAKPPFPLKNLSALTLSTTMTGHGTTNGHPTTGFDTTIHWQYEGKAPVDYTLSFALAEDLDGIPVQLRLNGKLGSALVDITSIARTAPDAAQFAVPAGYTLPKSIPEALGIKFPTPAPSATSSPVPKA